MKVKKVMVVVVSVWLLTACMPLGLEEAIQKEIPFNIARVLHKEEVPGGVVILYTTKQESKLGEFKTITAAFLKGDDQSGWSNAGNNHWDYYEHEQFTTYKKAFYDYDTKGELENKISLLLGRIENEKIKKIEVAGKEYEEAKVIEVDGERYYYQFGEYSKVRGLSENGKVVYRTKLLN